jgi:cellulose synthase/poly-beta-1,6-N-acetylglucosamine synthase-like glycosyltransferase
MDVEGMKMQTAVSALFWLSIAVIFLVYLAYPVVLWVLGRLRQRRVHKGPVFPTVSIVISAYNEEEHIGKTIENKLGLDYPEDRMELVVISDGSTDRTEEIVRKYVGKRVKLLIQPERQGKTVALNRAVAEARGEIVVFSDANSIYERSAVRMLVENFADEQVGYVTGQMVYVDRRGTLIGQGCSAYMRYENALRVLETRVGSVVGVDGGIDAVRRSLYEPMSPAVLPDFVLPLRVVERGFRVVYEDRALLKEDSLTQASDELKMRVRVILRSLHALWRMRVLFNPFRSRDAVFSFQLFVHKLLRYWVGFLQLAALICNAWLWDVSLLYRVLFLMQLVFYGLAVSGAGSKRWGERFMLARLAYYACLLNYAAVVASLKFLQRKQAVVWQPRKG